MNLEARALSYKPNVKIEALAFVHLSGFSINPQYTSLIRSLYK